MSEYINNSSRREEKLKEVVKLLHEGRSPQELRQEFNQLLAGASADEIVRIEQSLIAEGLPIEQVQFLCDVHVALFKETLDQQLPPEMQPGHPIYTFRAENEFVELLLHSIDEKLKTLQSDGDRTDLHNDLKKLQDYDRHYLRKENLLFPLLEKYDFSGPSSVMWGVHDDMRELWDALVSATGNEEVSSTVIKQKYEKLQHGIREMIYKEDRILFPNALQRLNDDDWATIYAGELEFGFAYVRRGEDWKPELTKEESEIKFIPEQLKNQKEMDMVELTLNVGKLTASQVNLLLQNLPIDVTFVDENDQVAFYSQSRERIFARTPAVIGRKVQLCHPPASVDKVQAIVDDFRTGTRDEAEFWIQMNGKFIHIRYFAVRDEAGAYRGTLEVTQDISAIRKLEGEKRLADG